MLSYKAKDKFVILTIYLCVLMHIYIKNNGGNGFSIPGNILGVIVIAIFIFQVQIENRNEKTIKSSTLFILLTLGSLFLFIPVLWTSGDWYRPAVERLFVVALGLMYYYSLMQIEFTREKRNHLMVLLLLATLIQALTGVAQYIFFQPGNFMGYDTQLNRPYGIFQQVNVMASFMATGLALALYLWNQPETSKVTRIVAGLMMFIGPWMLVSIGSRIGLLAALIVTPLQLTALLVSDRRSIAIPAGLISGGIIVAFVCIEIMGAGREIYDPSTIHFRMIAWRTCLEMIADKPWFGWGYGHFASDFIHYLHDNNPDIQQSMMLKHPHNEILLWWLEGGCIAFAGIILICFGFVFTFLKQIRFKKRGLWRRFCFSPWLIMVPIILHTQVELPLYQSTVHSLTLLCVLRTCDIRRKSYTFEQKTLLRNTIIAFSSFTLLYMASGLWVSRIVINAERDGLHNTSALDDITLPNPLQSRLEWDRNLGHLLSYQYSHDLRILVQYREWAEKRILTQPDANLYINLIAISRIQNDHVAEMFFIGEAKKLFPDEQRLFNVN